jgi:hypothetical protein
LHYQEDYMRGGREREREIISGMFGKNIVLEKKLFQ